MFDLGGGGVVGPVRLTDVDVIPAGITSFDEVLAADENLVKASWNWILVHTDGGKGVHNPDFSFKVLQAAIDVL